MIKTVIKKDLYKDSVSLMILNNEINNHEGVTLASIMMASPANKEMFEMNGLLTDEVQAAGANDVAIVLDLKDESFFDEIMDLIEAGLDDTSSGGGSKEDRAESLDEALEILPEANMAIISTPGIYAATVARRCLEKDLNLMIFSDNVALEDEVKLKEMAREKGLFVMGPDCGTSIVNGVPLAFANKVRPGKIGIVGASGTGLQEVVSVLDAHGIGISNAIGTGGRDLNEAVGGMTFFKALDTLMKDEETEVILALSKPPAQAVKEKVESYLMQADKPVAALFLGEEPDHHYKNFYRAETLEELALLGIDLLEGREPVQMKDEFQAAAGAQGSIKGLYSGGTLAGEAAYLIGKALGNPGEKVEGYELNTQGFEIIDLGDDKYTSGKPHPMIDPTARTPYILKAADDESTKAILLDVVIGYGANEDPAGTLVEVIQEVQAKRSDVEIIATVCGTAQDFQGLEAQKIALEELGVKVFRSNRQAVEYALSQVGLDLTYKVKPVQAREERSIDLDLGPDSDMLKEKLRIVNIGLEGFGKVLDDFNADVVQYDFRPIAGGNKEMMDVLEFLGNWRG